jgi:hypothetical protein
MRGTGLNNYNSSLIYIDDNALLDHSAFIGLFLCILDRRDLSIAHSGFYNTSKIPDTITTAGSTYHENKTYYDDFGVANAMATKIKEYGHGYFILVVS